MFDGCLKQEMLLDSGPDGDRRDSSVVPLGGGSRAPCAQCLLSFGSAPPVVTDLWTSSSPWGPFLRSSVSCSFRLLTLVFLSPNVDFQGTLNVPVLSSW